MVGHGEKAYQKNGEVPAEMNEASRGVWGWAAAFALLVSMGFSWRLLPLRVLPESGREVRERPGLLPAVSRKPGFAFGFRNVLADVAWLEAVQVAGNLKMARADYDRLYELLNVEANFDPRFDVPYLLGGLKVESPNQVWAMDITYIPMARGFVYLAVVLDWATRRVLSWRLSITMEAAFCVETLEDALARHGRPDIFNTDQGSQFTGSAFTGMLTNHDIAISMDGKGAWRDNVFVERLWRSVKYEEVYLRAYETVGEARASIGRYLDFYNGRRPHSSLDGRTPDQAYFNSLPLRLAA